MKKALLRRVLAIILTALMASAILPMQAAALSITPLDVVTFKKVTAPSNLKSTLSSGPAVTLSWTDNSSNESGFRLQCSIATTNQTIDFYDYADLTPNTTTYAITGLGNMTEAGYTAISFRVKAVGGGVLWDSNYSNVVTIDLKAPEEPQIRASIYYDGSVSISWSGVTPAYVDHFDIVRLDPGSSDLRKIADVTSDKTQYFDSSEKQPGGTYQYRVVAKGYFSYTFSQPVSITIQAAPPAAPSNLAVTSYIQDNRNNVKITWKDNSDNETGFVIEYSINGVVKDPIDAAVNGQEHTISGLPNGTFVFRVKAANGAGSAYSNTVTLTDPFSKPAAPSNLTAAVQNNGTVALTWTDNSNNESAFYIERQSGAGGFVKISEVGANVTSFADAGLAPSTVYTYRVVAVNSIGASDYSGTASVTTGGPTGIDYSSASSWAKPEIEAAEQYGLTGRLRGSFQQDITREEFCEIAIKLYEKLSHTQAVFDGNNPFTDTTNSEIIKAYKLGITSGTSPNTFSPNNPITRQEISAMLVRTLKAAFPGLSTSVTNPHVFADQSLIASWALEYIAYVNSKGIMNGVGGNLFNPLNQTTREQAIAIVKRTYETFR